MLLYNDKTKAVSKTLSANDTGETGSHQAGILVPKDKRILSFFPELNDKEKNPRTVLKFDDNSGCIWNFCFIYYNGKRFGGTRLEYRLTGMTSYIRQNNLKTGDKIIFQHEEMGKMNISYEREINIIADQSTEYATTSVKRLKLGSSWKVISI